MAPQKLKPATYEDLFDLPEHLVGEIIAGRLVTHPRPAPKHANAYSNLGFELGDPFHRGRGGPGGWWILDKPELHLDADILVPDIAGWRRERIPKLPETAWFELPTDWVCEIQWESDPKTFLQTETERLTQFDPLVSHDKITFIGSSPAFPGHSLAAKKGR